MPFPRLRSPVPSVLGALGGSAGPLPAARPAGSRPQPRGPAHALARGLRPRSRSRLHRPSSRTPRATTGPDRGQNGAPFLPHYRDAPGPATTGGGEEAGAGAALPRPKLGTGPRARGQKGAATWERVPETVPGQHREAGRDKGRLGEPRSEVPRPPLPRRAPRPLLTSAPRPPCAAPPPAAVNGFQTGLGRPNQPISARRTPSPRADWAIRRQASGNPDVPARRAEGDGKRRAQAHSAAGRRREANYNSHNAQGERSLTSPKGRRFE